MKDTSTLLSIAELKKQSAEDLQTILRQKIYYKYASYGVTSDYILPNQTLCFSSPSVFNDPFDCNEDLLDIHIDPASVKEFAKNDLDKFPVHIQERMIELAIHPRTYRAALQREKLNFKICCFSTKLDDVLMWSHYGDKHTGICLGFEFPIMGKDFSMYPVRYINEIRKLQGMADTTAIFNYWLTRKPLCWAYESEMRAISRSGEDYIAFNKTQLKEIIFGCRVTEQQIEKVIALIKELQFDPIVFKKMAIDPASFSLTTYLIF